MQRPPVRDQGGLFQLEVAIPRAEAGGIRQPPTVPLEHELELRQVISGTVGVEIGLAAERQRRVAELGMKMVQDGRLGGHHASRREGTQLHTRADQRASGQFRGNLGNTQHVFDGEIRAAAFDMYGTYLAGRDGGHALEVVDGVLAGQGARNLQGAAQRRHGPRAGQGGEIAGRDLQTPQKSAAGVRVPGQISGLCGMPEFETVESHAGVVPLQGDVHRVEGNLGQVSLTQPTADACLVGAVATPQVQPAPTVRRGQLQVRHQAAGEIHVGHVSAQLEGDVLRVVQVEAAGAGEPGPVDTALEAIPHQHVVRKQTGALHPFQLVALELAPERDVQPEGIRPGGQLQPRGAGGGEAEGHVDEFLYLGGGDFVGGDPQREVAFMSAVAGGRQAVIVEPERDLLDGDAAAVHGQQAVQITDRAVPALPTKLALLTDQHQGRIRLGGTSPPDAGEFFLDSSPGSRNRHGRAAHVKIVDTEPRQGEGSPGLCRYGGIRGVAAAGQAVRAVHGDASDAQRALQQFG